MTLFGAVFMLSAVVREFVRKMARTDLNLIASQTFASYSCSTIDRPCSTVSTGEITPSCAIPIDQSASLVGLATVHSQSHQSSACFHMIQRIKFQAPGLTGDSQHQNTLVFQTSAPGDGVFRQKYKLGKKGESMGGKRPRW